MKTVSRKALLAALVIGTAVTAVQAGESLWLLPYEEPQLMLAESGSDRMMEYRLQREALANQPARQDSGDRFVQMLREQPTAAGPMSEEKSEKMDRPKSIYRTPIQKDRELFGK